MLEVSIPIATLPDSPDSYVAIINNIDLFTTLSAGEMFLVPGNVMGFTFITTIVPAVFMTTFQIGTNGETVFVIAKLKDLDTIVDLTVILLYHLNLYCACTFERFKCDLEIIFRKVKR